MHYDSSDGDFTNAGDRDRDDGTCLYGTIISGRTGAIIIIDDSGTFDITGFMNDDKYSTCSSLEYLQSIEMDFEYDVEPEVIHEVPGFNLLYVLASYVVFLNRINARRLPDHFL